LFNDSTNTSVIYFINNSSDKSLFGLLWTKLLYRKCALEIAECESNTAGTVSSIEIVMDRSFFKTADKGFVVTH
jgi:hypothetical protein